GKILIGGRFTHYDGQEVNYIARLNSNGSLDQTFRPAIGVHESSHVAAIALQPDGRVLLGGHFTDPDGTKTVMIIRLNSDGSVDSTFNPKTHTDDSILSIAVQKDGRILIAGSLAVYNYPNRNHVLRLLADGSLDGSFNYVTANDMSSVVNKIILQEDGNIVIGGNFTMYDGQPRNRINRLNSNGSTDWSFTMGTGADGEVSVMTALADGGVLIAGDFSTYSDKKAGKLARLDRNGLMSDRFNPSTGASDLVSKIVMQQDGKLIISGAFTSYFGIARKGLARINTDGSLDAAFDPRNSTDGPVTALAVQQDGKILIGGHFNTFNNVESNYIARLNRDGSLDPTFISHPDFAVASIAVQANGKILIGGSFTSINGIQRNRIARLNANGSLDLSFNPSNGANGGVTAICMQPNGKILIGGYFTSYNGVARSRIARLNADGSLDTGFSPSTNSLSGNLSTILLQP
ncbi:MAG: hypothetical protein EOP49_37705, partial [Sphingobacteriales bacterium]